MTTVDQIYSTIRSLPVPDRLRLLERVVHDMVEVSERETPAETTGRPRGTFDFTAWLGMGNRAARNPDPRFHSDADLWR